MKVLVILCVLYLVQTGDSVESSPDNSTTVGPEVVEKTPLEKWKSTEKQVQKMINGMVKSMLPTVLKASEGIQLSSKCSRSMMKFLTGLKQMKDWAFRMVDASGKIPNGVYSGSINTFGDYDVCVDTELPGNFQGQYCFVDVIPPLPKRIPFVSYDEPIPEFINGSRPDTVTAFFMRKGMYYYHFKFRSSICMPSTCSKDEVQAIASKVAELAGIEFDVVVPSCEVKPKEIIFTNTEIGIMAVLSFIVALAVIGTITDTILRLSHSDESYQNNLSIPVRCLVCFSLYTNFCKLMREDNHPDSIKIFHGMKAITILWVILSHNYFYQNFQALNMLLLGRKKGTEFFFQLISNGVLTVETFFFISAVLVAYGVTMMKSKRLNIFLFVFRRLWRLTPPFMFVIGCTILLPYVGSGPVWNETVTEPLTNKCKKNWWRNLLYINNFISYREMCLNWMWYVPVDTQLYFLSILVLIPLQRSPRTAFIITGVIGIVGTFLTGAFQLYYNMFPIAPYVYMHPDDVNYFVDRGYFRTYLHMATYCVGITVGYLLASKKKIKIPLIANISGWIIALGLGLVVTFGVYDWHQGNLPSMFVTVLFACTNKLAWSLALAWVTLACMSGHGGIATSILSWYGFVPLSRLTYMTYLVHPLIHFTYIGSARSLIGADHRTLIHQYCGTVVISILTACAASMLFEAPFMALEKVFFASKNPQEKQEKEVNDNESKYESSFIPNGSMEKDSHNVYTVNFKKIDS